MNSKFLIYGTALIVLLVVAGIVDGKKSGDDKKKLKKHGKHGGWPAMMGCLKPMMDSEDATGVAFRGKLEGAMMECGKSLGLPTGSNSSSNSAPMKQSKEDKAKKWCLISCGMKTLGMLSDDGTAMNRTAMVSALNIFMLADYQEKYLQEVDSCLTKKKVTMSSVTLGDKCKGLKPYMHCLKKAGEKTCPAPPMPDMATTMMPEDSSGAPVMNDDVDSDEDDDDDDDN